MVCKQTQLSLALFALTFWLWYSVQISNAAPLAQGGTLYLPLVASGGTATTTPTTVMPIPVTPAPVTPTPRVTPNGGPSSEAKIKTAQARGEIDAETALIYRVYASFEDARLPAQYLGDDSDLPPSSALRQAQATWATLSFTTQQTLTHFLLPPSAPESWLEERSAVEGVAIQAAASQRITWSTACKSDPAIKVWYQDRFPEDADDARKICDEVRESIWPRLKSLMGRTPLFDSNQNNNGGDERLDLYLVPAKTATISYGSTCYNKPSYILVNHRSWNRSQLADAVMRAHLNSYTVVDCIEYEWLYNATATWATDYVYPADNIEHPFAKSFLARTDRSLTDSFLPSPEISPQELQNFASGTYLWMWYLTNWVTTPRDFVPKVWEGARGIDSLETVNTVLGSNGFKQHWKEFSLYNWNHQPVDSYAKSSDGLTHFATPKLDVTVELTNGIDVSYVLDGEVRYLASHSYRFRFDKPTLRSVMFMNPFSDGSQPTANVTALVKIEGQAWRREDWSTFRGKSFCRDLKAERLEELVIILSNHEWNDQNDKLKPAFAPRLNVTNIGCRGWEFSGEVTYRWFPRFVNITTTETLTGTFQLEPLLTDNSGGPFLWYALYEGSGKWSHNGRDGTCTVRGDGSFTFNLHGHTRLYLWLFATDDATATTYQPGRRGYTGIGTRDRIIQAGTYSISCPGSSRTVPYQLLPNWFTTETESTQQISSDGTTITGFYDDPENTGFSTLRWEWTMNALPPE